MALKILPCEKTEVTRLVCPQCGEKVRGVGLLKNSVVSGLSFSCKRCHERWKIETTAKNM